MNQPPKKIVLTQAEYDAMMLSVSNLTIFNTLMEIEYQQVLFDSKVRKPEINMLIKRIKGDTIAIKQHIKTISNTINDEFREDYSLALYEAVTHLVGFDIERLEGFNKVLREAKHEKQPQGV